MIKRLGYFLFHCHVHAPFVWRLVRRKCKWNANQQHMQNRKNACSSNSRLLNINLNNIENA